MFPVRAALGFGATVPVPGAWPGGRDRGRGVPGAAPRRGARSPAIGGPGPGAAPPAPPLPPATPPGHAARPRRVRGALVGGLAARAPAPRPAPAARPRRLPPAGPRLPAGTGRGPPVPSPRPPPCAGVRLAGGAAPAFPRRRPAPAPLSRPHKAPFFPGHQRGLGPPRRDNRHRHPRPPAPRGQRRLCRTHPPPRGAHGVTPHLGAAAPCTPLLLRPRARGTGTPK